MEQWKDIPGYVGRYQISDKGRVRSLQFKGKVRISPLVMKTCQAADGNVMVALTNEKKQQYKYTIPRLMAVAWLGLPIDSDITAYCKNGNKGDFTLENIGIATRSEMLGNSVRRPVRKVLRKTGEVVEVYCSVKEAARQNGMSYNYMITLLRRRPYFPEYIFEYDYDDRGHRHG